jgi:RNA methyltransferase, TrmH family
MQEITKITSKDNARLVEARKVRDGRNEELIFIEGRRLVEEALRSGLDVVYCFVSESFADDKLMEQILVSEAHVFELPNRLLDSIADTKNSQGIILLAKRPSVSTKPFAAEVRKGVIPVYVYLKEANNPSNLGALIRTAEGAGALGILLSPRSADPFSSKALRAAMGSAFRLPIWQNVQLGTAATAAKDHAFKVKAADVSGVVDYTETDWTESTLLVFGSEAHGLSVEDLSLVDERVKISLANDVESLNLAVAAGIVLFEVRRQVASPSKGRSLQ